MMTGCFLTKAPIGHTETRQEMCRADDIKRYEAAMASLKFPKPETMLTGGRERVERGDIVAEGASAAAIMDYMISVLIEHKNHRAALIARPSDGLHIAGSVPPPSQWRNLAWIESSGKSRLVTCTEMAMICGGFRPNAAIMGRDHGSQAIRASKPLVVWGVIAIALLSECKQKKEKKN